MLLSSSELGKALKQICRSYVFIHLELNLFGFDILANWIGYLLLLSAIHSIAREEKSAVLLRPFAAALAVMSGAAFVCGFLGVDIDPYQLLSIFHTLMWIYLQFQLLTNVAEMARRRSYPKTGRILMLRSALSVLSAVPPAVALFFDESWLVYAYAVLYLALVIWVDSVLISLRVYLWEHEESLDQMADLLASET